MPNYRKVARRAARRHGIDPDVFERQIQQESGFQPHIGSPAGAQGIAQIMPATARGWGVDPNNPRQALNAAAKNMRRYVEKYGGYENALRAYNAGPGAIKASKGYAETNNYVRTILGGRHPKVSQPHGGGDEDDGDTTTTTTRTPGVDNRQARAQLISTFLSDRDADPVDFAIQAKGLRDVAPTSRTSTTRSGGGGRGGGGGGGGGTPKGGSQIKELFWQGAGGIDIKDGKVVPQGFVSGHTDHVHVAAGPKTVDRLGRIAQDRFGLHVGENPTFGGVDPVHTGGSYHYKDQAIDVSGDPAKMRAYAQFVARYQKRRRR